MKYDFGGWATKANLKCSDGRVIMPDAFKDQDGATVPLVWNHQHNDPEHVLGHALLKNTKDGVYAYCKFNDTESGQTAKELVEHKDVVSLSIMANQLKQKGAQVMHGIIRELSLVLAGANPGATIDSVMLAHGDGVSEDSAIIYTGEDIDMDVTLEHSDIEHSDKTEETKETKETKETNNNEETVQDVIDSMNDKQRNVMYALIGQAIEDSDKEPENKKEGDDSMKHNVFDSTESNETNTLTHADGESIVALAKNKNVGSLQQAIHNYVEDNFGDSLQHGFDNIDVLFPEIHDLTTGAPERVDRDLKWVDGVINAAHKSPFSRIRSKQMDTRGVTGAGRGYTKGTQKKNIGNSRLIKRETTPQTIYVKDALDRDDIIDITDFDVVAYQQSIMKDYLKEKLALAMLVSDLRADDDEDKIEEEHIRPIWKDDELYTIHYKMKQDGDYVKDLVDAVNLTGDVTDYSESYKFAEYLVAASLFAREEYKGDGVPTFYCPLHYLNMALMARDLNGHRLYKTKAELAQAMNVKDIITVEQMKGLTRQGTIATQDANQEYELIGLFVNWSDYTLGATKGGEITGFDDFDIDFNQQKMLIETRLCGALTKIKSAVALEYATTING